MWIPQPRKLPYIDPLVGVGGSDAGPYFETSLVYFPFTADQGYDERLMTLAVSTVFIRDALSAPGSPGVFMDKDEYDSLIQGHHSLTEQVADLNAQLEEAQAELRVLKNREDPDVIDLADKIASRLGQHNIKRGPGRPPKVA